MRDRDAIIKEMEDLTSAFKYLTGCPGYGAEQSRHYILESLQRLNDRLKGDTEQNQTQPNPDEEIPF